jgi:hypothetical protein
MRKEKPAMRPISYARATDIASAIATVSADHTRAWRMVACVLERLHA